MERNRLIATGETARDLLEELQNPTYTKEQLELYRAALRHGSEKKQTDAIEHTKTNIQAGVYSNEQIESLLQVIDTFQKKQE